MVHGQNYEKALKGYLINTKQSKSNLFKTGFKSRRQMVKCAFTNIFYTVCLVSRCSPCRIWYCK